MSIPKSKVKKKNNSNSLLTSQQMSIEEILKPKIEKIVQELLEREKDELVGRDYYENYRDDEERL